MAWLQAIMYGLVGGLTEYLPVSADANTAMMAELLGMGDAQLVALLTHAGCLAALLSCCRREMARLHRDSRRKRESQQRERSVQSRLTLRILRTAGWILVVCLLLSFRTRQLASNLSLTALFLVLNGVLLYLPRFFSSGNKDARSMSRLDAVLLGAGAGLSLLPGFSRVGAVVSLAEIRGAGRQYALNLALLLSMPALAVLMVMDVLGIVLGGLGAITVSAVLQALLAGIMAFLGGCCGIYIMRFLSVKSGYTGFAYYCWGAALFAFVLYMI